MKHVKIYRSGKLIASKMTSRSWATRYTNKFVERLGLRIASDWCAGGFRRIQAQERGGLGRWFVITLVSAA